MARVHARQEIFGGPVRFVEWIAAEPIFIDLVFIAIDPVRGWMLIMSDGDFKQRVFRKLVVMIEQSNELARSNLQRRVRRFRYMAILRAADHFDPAISPLVLFEQSLYMRSARAIVRYA